MTLSFQETNRAIEETNKHTRNGQREVNTRLNQRINKVEHWTSEIDEKLTDLNNEIDALLDYKVYNIFLSKIFVFRDDLRRLN